MLHKVFFFAAMVILIAPVDYAHAQSRVELFGGYSFLHGSVNNPMGAPLDHLSGWNVAGAVKLIPHIQAVADIGGYYASSPGFPCVLPEDHYCGPFSTAIYDALFGPQVSVSIAKIRPFAHALFGVAHMSTSGTPLILQNSSVGSDTAYANAFGGGVDYWLTHRLGLRAQADYFPNRLFTYGGFLKVPGHANLRFSTGIVFRP